MTEIEKLRHRLKAVGKNTTEYRMTVVEAKNLLIEIDVLLEKLNKPKEEITIIEPTLKVGILDGGTF